MSKKTPPAALGDNHDMSNTVQGEIITALLRKFPKAPSKTIATIAYRDNPACFKNLEAARTSVRHYRGAMGKLHRAYTKSPEFVRPLQKPGDPFGRIPDGLTHFGKPWAAVDIPGPLACLVLADAHIPYHDRTALLTALEYGKSNGADTVLLNGDCLDCFSVSKWEKDPRQRDFAAELETTRTFLGVLRETFPKARLIYKLGNHEERFESYMRCKAPEMLGVEDFELHSLLRFADYGIEEVKEKRPVRLGTLNVLHGHEYRFAISNPVNAARGLFLRCKAYAMCAHFHQQSSHSEKTVEGKQVGTWSTGCLCQLHQDYAPLNNWTHGCAMVRVDKAGKFQVNNAFIANGKIF
jgi:predicted phosphodiesterase